MTMRGLNYSDKTKCPTCAGVGERTSGNKCVTCGGTGKVGAKDVSPMGDVERVEEWAKKPYKPGSVPKVVEAAMAALASKGYLHVHGRVASSGNYQLIYRKPGPVTERQDMAFLNVRNGAPSVDYSRAKDEVRPVSSATETKMAGLKRKGVPFHEAVKQLAEVKPVGDLQPGPGKIHKGTWLGKSGKTTTWPLDKNRTGTGLRVVLQELDGGPSVASLIKGDGRRSGFKKLASGVVKPVGDADHADPAIQAKIDAYRKLALKQGFKPDNVERSIRLLLKENRFKATSKVATDLQPTVLKLAERKPRPRSLSILEPKDMEKMTGVPGGKMTFAEKRAKDVRPVGDAGATYDVSYALNGPMKFQVTASQFHEWARKNGVELSNFKSVLDGLRKFTGDPRIKDWEMST